MGQQANSRTPEEGIRERLTFHSPLGGGEHFAFIKALDMNAQNCFARGHDRFQILAMTAHKIKFRSPFFLALSLRLSGKNKLV